MNKEDGLALICQSALFRRVSPEGLEMALKLGVLRSVEEDGFYFLQGDKATHAYVLFSGRVKMLQYTPNGQQIVMRMVMPGQTFGGIALLQPEGGYPATAQTVQDSLAIGWDTESLSRLAQHEPALSLNVMDLMHGYILELQERQQALIAERVEQRIARILLKLAAQTGKKTAEGIVINIPITRQDIAEMSGTTLYSVSRILNEWERKNLLRIGRERVMICDPHGLVMIVENLKSPQQNQSEE